MQSGSKRVASRLRAGGISVSQTKLLFILVYTVAKSQMINLSTVISREFRESLSLLLSTYDWLATPTPVAVGMAR